MFKSTAVLMAIAVSANAQYFEWAGKTADFTESSLWQGPNPVDPSTGIPASTTVGTTSIRTWTTLTQGKTFNVGSKLNLQGNTKLILGDGTGKTIISFAASTDANPKPSSFKVAFVNNEDQGTFYDWNCNLNWKKVAADGTSSISDRPPCVTDFVFFPAGSAYYVSNMGTAAGARQIKYGKDYDTAEVIVQSCNDENPDVPVTFDLNVNTCENTFNFNGAGGTGKNTCGPSYNTCKGTVVQAGNKTIVVLGGDRTGTVFTNSSDGTFTNSSDDYDITTSDGTDGTDGTDINVVAKPAGGTTATPIVIGKDGVITQSPTQAPSMTPTKSPVATVTQAGSVGDNSSAGMGMGIIIGAAVGGLVLIILIVLVLVFMLRKGSSDKDERNIVSFENPMYDDVQGKENPAFGADEDTGIYDDPEMATDDTGGYMDVPAGNGNNDSSGYMDVPANDGFGGGGGYMDVAPNVGDDDESDDSDEDESEQEDI